MINQIDLQEQEVMKIWVEEVGGQFEDHPVKIKIENLLGGHPVKKTKKMAKREQEGDPPVQM